MSAYLSFFNTQAYGAVSNIVKYQVVLQHCQVSSHSLTLSSIKSFSNIVKYLRPVLVVFINSSTFNEAGNKLNTILFLKFFLNSWKLWLIIYYKITTIYY